MLERVIVIIGPRMTCYTLTPNIMSRNEFEAIKLKLKTSKISNKNEHDKVWKIRALLNIFRRNIQQFGFFSSAMAVDEMMMKFFGRTVLKQFIRNEPIRFGIKLWALCAANGFLLDLDIYCGKNDCTDAQKFSKCALGSGSVLKMLHQFLMKCKRKDVVNYHVYFDNFFSSPDLLVHLKNLGLRATKTVREDRVFTIEMFHDDNKSTKISSKKTKNPERQTLLEKHKLSKKDPRGTDVVSHELNSGINYITVLDNKQVSFLSTAIGVIPFTTSERYNRNQKNRVMIDFPRVFELYNLFMGGVDLYDQHCGDLEIHIHGKKWTWTILRRLIQSSLTNAMILYNMTNNRNISAKDMIFRFECF